jgi:hypothetical protein
MWSTLRRGAFVLGCVLLVLATHPRVAAGAQGGVDFDAGQPGVAVQLRQLWMAVPLINKGSVDAEDVTVYTVRLGRLRRVRPEELPLGVGQIAPGAEQVLQLGFRLGTREKRGSFFLLIEGLYRVAGRRHVFRVYRRITVPPSGAGEIRSVARGPIAAELSGDYPPSDVGAHPEEANPSERLPLPEGVRVGGLRPSNAPVSLGPFGGDTIGSPPALPAEAAPQGVPNDPVSFVRAGTHQPGGGVPWDPSGASVDVQPYPGGPLSRLVFLTGNTYALLSTDGGASFTQLDPTTIFPNFDPQGNLIDGGLCCDQVAHYIPGINRVVWLMQFWPGRVETDPNGNVTLMADNRLRLAAASPEQIVASGGTAWTYWDITTATLGLTNQWFDYPDLAFSDNFLFISVDAPNSSAFLVMRVPLGPIQNAQAFSLDLSLENSSPAYGTHLAQNSPGAAYWFAHRTQSQIRAYEWRDNDADPSWQDVTIQSWSNTNYATNAPNAVNCMGDVGATVAGATLVDSQTTPLLSTRVLRFAWTAGRGGGFPQPQVRIVDLLRVRLSVPNVVAWGPLAETQVWNQNVAFLLPALATNPNHETGLSVSFCGGGYHTTPAAGFVHDTNLFYFNLSQDTIVAGDGRVRYGDYMGIRRHWPNTNLFSVSDYALAKVPESTEPGAPLVTIPVHQYRLFGRTADVGSTY